MSNANGKRGAGEPENRIIAPLTVLFAQVQLLQRRIQRGHEIGNDDLRQAVERMDSATRAIIAGMGSLDTTISRARSGKVPASMEGRGSRPGREETRQMTGVSNSDEGGRATPAQMSRKHVFVVNGSPEFLDIVRQLLQDENYNVTTTNFVPRSFETIETAQPELLIIDLVIGEQAGWNLLAQLRAAATTRDIPVLLVSTRPQLLDEAREKHNIFGGDSYLTKPFDLDDLLDHIAQLIGKA